MSCSIGITDNYCFVFLFTPTTFTENIPPDKRRAGTRSIDIFPENLIWSIKVSKIINDT